MNSTMLIWVIYIDPTQLNINFRFKTAIISAINSFKLSHKADYQLLFLKQIKVLENNRKPTQSGRFLLLAVLKLCI